MLPILLLGVSASAVGCAGGQYTAPPNPYGTPAYGGVAYPPGTVVPPAGSLQPPVVMPPTAASTTLPGTSYPAGALPATGVPAAAAAPAAMPTDIPFGYPSGTDPATAAPLAAMQPAGAAPAPAYTAGVPLHQLDQSRPYINLAR